ncbi:MAG: phosphoenolpyruvate carboxykinase (ATP), partial [Thermoguttaceae bacterium]|nr:phosphoenolpyruvate carboxykinase (ATP) [Thermoguttaceae bacterium]
PAVYAKLLADNMQKYDSRAWLVNTGWAGGKYGVGSRLSIKHTRAIVDGIHSGELAGAECVTDPIFGLHVPKHCQGVPSEVLLPSNAWSDKADYEKTARGLAKLFHENFAKYEDLDSDIIQVIKNAGPPRL